MTADKSDSFCSSVDRVIHGYRDSWSSTVGLPVMNSNFLIKVTFENGVDNKSEKIYRRLSLPTTADAHTPTENIRYDRVG